MPRQVKTSVENNFNGGLKTEFTGLNFPENACTDCDNTVFSLLGNITRRKGFDFETNGSFTPLDRSVAALSTFIWENAGGDGSTKLFVVQVGLTIYFYKQTAATALSPLSTQKLVGTVGPLVGTAGKTDLEVQYASGNGNLFVFHPFTDPIVVTYNPDTDAITWIGIVLKVRDFDGIVEPGGRDQDRPSTLTLEHQYNLQNQGWSSAPVWSSNSTSTVTVAAGSRTFTVDAGLPVVIGSLVQINGQTRGSIAATMNGSVTSYVGTTLVVNVTSVSNPDGLTTYNIWNIFPFNAGLIDDWKTAEGNYPSNSDVWWRFKNASGVYDPATTQPNVTLNTGPAPKGAYILNAFNLDRTAATGILGLTPLIATKRPRTGSWFQGRIWYAGVDASQAATGDQGHYSWSENIYFSQVVSTTDQLNKCYQTNDPTSEELFDLLPTDGGVIVIQGAGAIYKLFPIQNGMLVFAANGVWFITGSQGIGFTASDYTITKVSSVKSISGSSFVDVLGMPTFWNDDGIYSVSSSQGGLTLNNICLGTIQSFYDKIPRANKKSVRGAYNPITFIISWIFKDVAETNATDRYEFNRVLNFNTSSKSFYPYTLPTGPTMPYIHGVEYVISPLADDQTSHTIKYLTSYELSPTSYNFSFAEEFDPDYVDWSSKIETNYTSYLVTGYKLHGDAQRKFQASYIYVYSDATEDTAYKIQNIRNFAKRGDTGMFGSVQRSSIQTAEINDQDLAFVSLRHKLRGSGLSLQFKFISVDGSPFNIIGWSIWETINASI
jgi:hypothetical protein